MTGIFMRVGCPARGTGVAVGGGGVAVGGGGAVAVGASGADDGVPLDTTGVADTARVGVAGAAVGVAGTLVAVGAAATVVGEAGAVVAVGAKVGVAEPPHALRNTLRKRSSAASREPRRSKRREVTISKPTFFSPGGPQLGFRTTAFSIGDRGRRRQPARPAPVR